MPRPLGGTHLVLKPTTLRVSGVVRPPFFGINSACPDAIGIERLQSVPCLPHPRSFAPLQKMGDTQPVKRFGCKRVACVGCRLKLVCGFAQLRPRHQTTCFPDPQRRQKLMSRQIAHRLVLKRAVPIHENYRRRPYYMVRPVEGPVLLVIDIQLDRQKILLDIRGHFRLWIRHGIQKVAACSGPLAEINQQIATLRPGALERRFVVGFPLYPHSLARPPSRLDVDGAQRLGLVHRPLDARHTEPDRRYRCQQTCTDAQDPVQRPDLRPYIKRPEH